LKKVFIVLVSFLVASFLLAGCNKNTQVQNEKKTIEDYVTIKEEFNQEIVDVTGEKNHYIYKVPVLKMDKPGAKKVNEKFLSVEKDIERRLLSNQLMPRYLTVEAYLNDGIVSLMMDIGKTAPGGITVANYDIEKDRELSTKELLDRYQFDPQKLLDAINEREEIDNNKPDGQKELFTIDRFVDPIIDIMYPNDYIEKSNEMWNKPREEKEKFVVENIDKLKVYLNENGKFVFICYNALPSDVEFVVN